MHCNTHLISKILTGDLLDGLIFLRSTTLKIVYHTGLRATLLNFYPKSHT